MTNMPQVDKTEAERHEHAPVRYRCVCGASFDFVSTSECECPHCGRHYHHQVLADTMTFAGEFAPQKLRLDAADSDSLIGTNKGHYRIVSRLGQGGMGAVYQAVDESLQRYVALKVIRRRDASRELVDQLVQEARAQARVNHPNVVHIYFVGQSDESPFFAMELIPGKTLADRLAQGTFPFSSVMRIGLQVASALDRAIQFDIVHGDIKPSNILEVDSETVKISDFGLSRRLSTRSDASDQLLGTPNYLSPEAVRGEKVDARSDIYSLGITLYELTFGHLPYSFDNESLHDRLNAHLTQAPVFPEPWPPSLPEAWRDILTRMMAKDPAERYQNYAELIADLTRLQPRKLIPAARLSRAIAWLFDSLAVTILHALCVGPTLVINAFASTEWGATWKWPANIVGTALSAFLLLGVMWLQVRWRTTPGKLFFDLTIVDRHGLRPAHRKLALRALFQFPWLVYFFSPIIDGLGLSLLDVLLGGLAVLVVLINAGFLIFRSDHQALHDRLLGTRVVVKTD